MIICILGGGLGNQMFEAANAYTLARENRTKLVFDFGEFILSKSRKPLIQKMKIINAAENCRIHKDIRSFWLKHMANEITEHFFHRVVFSREINDSSKLHIITMSKRDYDPTKINVCCGVFQREKFFQGYRDELLELMVPNYVLNCETLSMIDEISNCQSISVHIRRGDFTVIGAALSMDYYHRAMEYMRDTIGENIRFFVFSDDIEFCKRELNGYPCSFVHLDGENADVDEMMLMAKCKHNIIANSTYSWWSAWLNKSGNRIVVAPATGISQEILLDSWIKL